MLVTRVPLEFSRIQFKNSEISRYVFRQTNANHSCRDPIAPKTTLYDRATDTYLPKLSRADESKSRTY